MGKLQRVRWPEIGPEYTEIAEAVFRAMSADRAEIAMNVTDEQNLEVQVTRYIDLIPQNAGRFRVQQVVAAKLSDAEYRKEAILAAMVRCSRFYPISRLIYLLPDIEAIQCKGSRQWIVRGPGVKAELTDGNPFQNDLAVEELLRDIITNMQGVTGSRQLTTALPVAQSQIGTVMRLTVAIKPAVSDESGVTMTIRLPKPGRMTTLAHYVEANVFPREVAEFLAACVKARVNIAITGGTVTGKTTLMRVLCGLFEEDETVVLIEEVAELQLTSTRAVEVEGRIVMKPWCHIVIPLVAVSDTTGEQGSVSYTFLNRAALRQDPDRIVVGEARGPEMAEALSGMTTGHEGSLVSLHAESAEDAINRMTDMVTQHPNFTNEGRAERLVRRGIEIIVHLKHTPEGGRRLTGVFAVSKTGNDRWVYRENDDGVIVRETSRLEDLERIRHRLSPYFRNGEVPST
ncbi:MAG: ATPase, T2SS/T4P/T4SS family [Candidatus Dormibacteria bacterium]